MHVTWRAIIVHKSQNSEGSISYRQLEMIHLSQSVCSSQLVCRQSRLSLTLFCSCSSLIVQTQFVHSVLRLLSLRLSLLVTHTHFLTFTGGQQIRPSYQQISSEQNEVGLETHVPASDGFVTGVKVWHTKPRPAH